MKRYAADFDPSTLVVERCIHSNAVERIKVLEAAMQKFVDRVEAGEVRSTKTYAEFRGLLAQRCTDINMKNVIAFLEKAEELESMHPFIYVEIARTRTTGYMAWIKEKPSSSDHIACGQGETADEACGMALEDS